MKNVCTHIQFFDVLWLKLFSRLQSKIMFNFFFFCEYFRLLKSAAENSLKQISHKKKTYYNMDGGFALGEKAPGVFEIYNVL